jgi:V/A-type H+/Na+-transporting ATPase subunit I
MAIVPMQKVAVLAEKAKREPVLDALQQEGVLEIAQTSLTRTMDHTEVNFRAAELQFAIDTLTAFADKATLASASRTVPPHDILRAAQSTDVRGIVDRLHELEEEDTVLHREMQELVRRAAALAPWQQLPENIHGGDTQWVTSVYGMVPVENSSAIHALHDDPFLRVDLKLLEATQQHMPCRAIVWKESLQAFEERVTALGWTTVEMPRLSGTPAELLEQARIEQHAFSARLVSNAHERRDLSKHLPSLLRVRTFIHWLHDKQAAREALHETFGTMLLQGWMPRGDTEKLEKALRKVSPAVAVFPVTPDSGEEPPVALRNSAFITPYESVTKLYGLPLASEIDPTRPLAPFFTLYFALCLTDGGYGLVLSIVFGTWLLLRRSPPSKAPLQWLLFMSGIASILVGIPFGGWFGLSPEQVPSLFTTVDDQGALRFLGQIWNLSSQQGISFLQNLALTLGLVHIFFGIFLAGWHKWIHGAKAEAFWQHFSLHLLLGAALFSVVAPDALALFAQWTLWAAVAIAAWGKGYGYAWYLRPIMGALGIVNFAIGFLSNILSYLRILALGLVTGAIALAVNQVAIEMARLFPPLLSIPIMILIVTLGHLVSIALNTLGSFIHAGRLQFIEFFGQFFEGGGRQFSPFQRSVS